MSKCRLFHDWRLIVDVPFSSNGGWLFLDCHRCGKSKSEVTSRYFEAQQYYWTKESINWLERQNRV